jgi:hypothetical protein
VHTILEGAAEGAAVDLLMVVFLSLSVWKWTRRTLEYLVTDKLFVFIRRYGLDDPVRHLDYMIVARDFRILRRYVYSRRRAVVLLICLLSLIFCAIGSWIAALFLMSVFVVGIWIVLSALRYAASAGSEFSYGFPRLRLPALPRRTLDHLALRIYWYESLDTRLIGALCCIWLFLILCAISDTKPYRAQDVIALIIATCLYPMMFSVTRFLMERKRVFDRIITMACYLLDPKSKSRGSDRRQFRSPIDDPLELRRTDLGNLVGVLSDAARMLDAQQVRGITPHPVSTMLCAASLYIREYLSSERSLCVTIPEDVLDVLRSVVMILVAPGEGDGRQALLQHVKAFDGDGNPAVNLEGRPPSRVVVAAHRAATAIAAIQPPIVNLASIAVICTALALFILHKLNIIDTLHFLP